MRPFLLHIARFLLFAAPAYLILLLLWGRFVPAPYGNNLVTKRPGSSFLAERLAEMPFRKGADLLVMGTSLAHRGIDPRVFRERGYQVFLLSSGGQTPTQMRALLGRYLDSLQPKCVLISVFPEFLTEDKVEPDLDLLLSDRVDAYSFRAVLRHHNLRLAHTFCYRAITEAFGLVPGGLQQENKLDRYIPGGFLERKVPLGNQSLAEACTFRQPWPLHPALLGDLAKSIGLLRARNIPVLMVQTPLASRRYRCYQHAGEADRLFSGLGVYYNFNGRIGLSDSLDYFDNTHLSPSGAVKFSRALCDQLERDGFLKH